MKLELMAMVHSPQTTLSRFVAWMNGLSIFQIQVSNRYTAADFDEDLRTVLRRAGCKGEKMCFIMDESNALDSAFLERMNTLLANAEIPGLFEGDEFQALMNSCKEGSQRDGLMLDSTDELYRWFTSQISKNLHVVFTMNPPSDGVAGRTATSPALFNRCVLNWFGNWSNRTLFQVGTEMTVELDLDNPEYDVPATLVPSNPDMPKLPSHREAVANAMVTVHLQVEKAMRNLQDQGRSVPRITPRHFLDL
jgi:dynein heavy chain 1